MGRYGESLRAAANPLGITPELWAESRAHATVMLHACAKALALPEDERRARKKDDDEVDPIYDLLAPATMGSLWACCRARLTDSLSAMETLVRISLETVVELAEDSPVELRAAAVVRAAKVINRIGSLHIQAAAFSYDAELLAQVEQAIADDRSQLARDLHDRLGTTLVLAFRNLELYRAKVAVNGPGARNLAAIEESLHEATSFTRGLISGLRAEAPLTSLSEALNGCVDELNILALPVTVSVNGDETWVPAAFRDEIFLVVREFIRNSFAHAAANAISVRVGITPRRVDVEASDDGLGFPCHIRPGDQLAGQRVRVGAGGGTGLVAMWERTTQLGGEFSMTSAPGKGTRMRLWIPLPRRGSGAADLDHGNQAVSA